MILSFTRCYCVTQMRLVKYVLGLKLQSCQVRCLLHPSKATSINLWIGVKNTLPKNMDRIQLSWIENTQAFTLRTCQLPIVDVQQQLATMWTVYYGYVRSTWKSLAQKLLVHQSYWSQNTHEKTNPLVFVPDHQSHPSLMHHPSQ